METALDLSRWREKPRGIDYRRWVIVSAGLRQLFKTRFYKALFTASWLLGLLIAVAAYLGNQFLVEGGWLETALANQRQGIAVLKSIRGLAALFPDIMIGGSYTVVFWVHSFIGLWISLLALTTMVPQLITRDRANHALIIYLSRPLTSADYLLGKFGMIVGLLLVLWTGPLLFGWLLSLLVTADPDFVVHSIPPLLRALAFNGIALVVIAPIALGISALARSSRVTIGIWLGLWVVAAGLAKFPESPLWLQRASFYENLAEVRLKVLPVSSVLTEAVTKLPLLDAETTRDLNRMAKQARTDEFNGAVAGLCVLVVLAGTVFLRRIRAE